MSFPKAKVFAAAGYNTTYYGPGRVEFDPNNMPSFESYLKETAKGTLDQLKNPDFDEGVIGSFIPARFINQSHIAGFLPFMVPTLRYKPGVAVEGACGTGGKALATAIRSVLSGLADSVFVAGFEVQNTMKSVYGADVLAAAAYYAKERKKGQAHFFPGIFSERAGAYYAKWGYESTRLGMAEWYELMIKNARKNPKAQEYENKTLGLFDLALLPPDPEKFLPHLNPYDCSKVSDGASSLVIASQEGLERLGIPLSEAVAIVGLGEAEDDITLPPEDLTRLMTTERAAARAFMGAGITKDDLGCLEIHDCFSITALLVFEALGFAEPGQAFKFIMDKKTTVEGIIPTNLSGGLIGFGHPTGATGVRQMVDLLHQCTGKALNRAPMRSPYGMMVSMGGNDKTVTSIIVTSLVRPPF